MAEKMDAKLDYANQKVEIFKPRIDVRYSAGLQTRTLIPTSGCPMSSWSRAAT